MKKQPFSALVRQLGKIGIFLAAAWLVALTFSGGLLLLRGWRLQKMLQQPAALHLDALAETVRGARQEFTVLRQTLTPALWLLSPLGGDAAALGPLLAAGQESLAAADETLSALAPTLGSLSPDSLSLAQMPQILEALNAARPALVGAENHLAQAETLLAALRAPLSPRLTGWVAQAARLIHLARAGALAAQSAPGLLGQAAGRNYLILIQNSDELRPTGGFISAVGRLQVKNGQVTALTLQNSYEFDDFTREYPYPPQPLLNYMGSEQWVLRDANWSPDFPTSARQAIRLYQISRPEAVDGVIAINAEGMQTLLAGLEPLTVPGFAGPVSSANLGQILRDAWNPPADSPRTQADFDAWLSNRKQFIGVLLRAALDKLQAGDANWSALAQGALTALSRRQLMIFSAAEADLLNRAGWDGAVRPAAGDFLMVVDANLGFSKSNLLIENALEYRVNLAPDGAGRAALTLRYRHTGTPGGAACTQKFEYDWTVTYSKMVNRCYFDYLRVITPPGSQLRQADVLPVPGAYLLSGVTTEGQAAQLADELPQKSVFGQFFVVENGQQTQTSFEYDLPQVATATHGQWRYTLLLQKQPGARPLPVKIQISLPPNARLISAWPGFSVSSENVAMFDLTLEEDREIEIVYALAP